MKGTSPLRDRELVEMLGQEPELLAIAHALVETHPRSRAHIGRVGGRVRRPVLAAAVVTLALAGAGAAVAAGLGAFNGISAAKNTPTGAAILPAPLLAEVTKMNADATAHSSSQFQIPQLLPETARVIGTMPDGSKEYGLSNTRGDLCLIGEVGGSCGPPLSSSHPITFGGGNASPTAGGTLTVAGVAMDGVTSVSFTVAGNPVTVPVKNNVYVYTEANSNADGADCIVAHFADGSTVNAFPEVPCP